MLTLERNLGESIYIGDDIIIQLVSIKHYKAKIGITAPKKMSVHRSEIYQMIQREKEFMKFRNDVEKEINLIEMGVR